ncbi:MAG: alpha/beta fold hydrolase [Opitutales bacterium]|nr:alpha/beta fold hydrolase [Opitutales bacterium]
MNQTLYYEEFGSSVNPPLICLHGLLGSSRNWRSVAKSMSESHHVFTLDLRNHGQSFHSHDATIESMVEDVLLWMDLHEFKSSHFCGHSLGGKVVMKMACVKADRVDSAVVGDIAPRNYPEGHHVPTLEALLSLDLKTLESRKDADEKLTDYIPSWAFRQFLLTNLDFVGGEGRWIPNLQVLRSSISLLSKNPLQAADRYDGPSLFIRGSNSGYIRTEHFDDIYQFFPNGSIQTMDGVGHDVHVENRALFVNMLQSFLS